MATAVATKMSANLKAAKNKIRGKRSKRNFIVSRDGRDFLRVTVTSDYGWFYC